MAVEVGKLMTYVVLAPGGNAGIAVGKLATYVVLANNARSTGGKTPSVVTIIT